LPLAQAGARGGSHPF